MPAVPCSLREPWGHELPCCNSYWARQYSLLQKYMGYSVCSPYTVGMLFDCVEHYLFAPANPDTWITCTRFLSFPRVLEGYGISRKLSIQTAVGQTVEGTFLTNTVHCMHVPEAFATSKRKQLHCQTVNSLFLHLLTHANVSGMAKKKKKKKHSQSS